MDWWENWLGSIVGPELVFPVTWSIVCMASLAAILMLSGRSGPR